MPEPKVVARYDSTSPATAAWLASRRPDPRAMTDSRLPMPALELRGLMMIAFADAKARFDAGIESHDLFSVFVEDATMDLFRAELRRIDDELGIPAGVEDW